MARGSGETPSVRSPSRGLTASSYLEEKSEQLGDFLRDPAEDRITHRQWPAGAMTREELRVPSDLVENPRGW